jgi:hypothetical protein
MEVTIDWVIHEDPAMEDYGTFTASGPAVDEGSVCHSGTTVSVFWEQARTREISHVEYTCEDDSGTFIIESEYSALAKPGGVVEETGTWIIWEGSGTGAYERLSGSGALEGIIRFRETDRLYPTNASETFTGHVAGDG